MSEPVQQPTPLRRTGGGWGRASVLLPAGTFLVGLALGAVVIGVGQDGDGDGTGGAARPVTATPTPPAASPTGPALVVRVPGACVEAADQADTAYQIISEAVAAARDLDARRLQELVDQVQQGQQRARALVAACREQAATGVTAPAPAPSPTR